MALRISIANNIPDIDSPNNLLDARSLIPQELRHPDERSINEEHFRGLDGGRNERCQVPPPILLSK